MTTAPLAPPTVLEQKVYTISDVTPFSTPKTIKSTKVKSFDLPVDKLNSVAWGGHLADQNEIEIETTSRIDRNKRNEIEAIILYRIDFNDLEDVEITKQLTLYDKRVYIAVASLYNAGIDTMSVTQIHKAMGNDGQPDSTQVLKINKSITKMTAARIYVNNSSEHNVYPRYKQITYDAALLPCERVCVQINGRITDAAIHLFREPPLLSFARERKQITTLSLDILKSPLSKTETNLFLEDYLLRNISHMTRESHFSQKMLFNTIYDKAKITGRVPRARAQEKIRQLLDFYCQQGLIKGYSVDNYGVTIQVTRSNKNNHR